MVLSSFVFLFWFFGSLKLLYVLHHLCFLTKKQLLLFSISFSFEFYLHSISDLFLIYDNVTDNCNDVAP